jgi:hypothetical protein
VSYYVRVATRGSATRGTPRQALNYITDGHDARRDPSYSDAELHYIARMDPGWKTDLEGGRVPLVGFGELAGETDEKALATRFEDSCQPYHDIRGTTGYKSITLTVPKEVSLYAEGHREKAKEAINAAVKTALDRAFPGLRYSAVAAIHTRNQVGEIHYHVHVLVGKFARDIETNRMVSLNGKAGRNGPARVRDMKLGWQEGIEKEFRHRLKLGIEQKTPRSPVTLVLPDGSRLEPLNRESRRLLEKQICPTFSETTKSGETITRHFRWSAMDDRIFEIASGARGTSSWSLDAFKEAFPDQSRYLSRYESRVHSLQAIGYLSPQGQITPAFRVHFAAHHGVLTPELQRVRLDLLQKLSRDKLHSPATLHPTQFWTQVQRYEQLRRRIERLGYSRDEINTIFARAEARKPTRQTLQLIRTEAEKKAALAPPPKTLPQTKTILRAYVDLQKSKFQRIYLITSGVIQFWKFGEKRALALQLKKIAERDLFFAKEKRLAQVGRALRPVIWLVRVTMPREARRLDQAITRCARLAQQQQMRKAGRDEIQRAYEQWRRDFIQKPLAQLKRDSQALQHPAQQADRPKLDKARQNIRLPDSAASADVFRRGYAALAASGTKEIKTTDSLRSWIGKEEQLVAQVLRHSNGEQNSLTPEQYSAAVRVGRVGHLLATADATKPLRVPDAFTEHKKDIERLSARLQSLGLRTPFTPANLAALSPVQVRTQLDAARKSGLLDDGPGWTFKASAARAFTQDVGRQIEQTRNVDLRLEDQLISRKGKPS